MNELLQLREQLIKCPNDSVLLGKALFEIEEKSKSLKHVYYQLVAKYLRPINAPEFSLHNHNCPTHIAVCAGNSFDFQDTLEELRPALADGLFIHNISNFSIRVDGDNILLIYETFNRDYEQTKELNEFFECPDKEEFYKKLEPKFVERYIHWYNSVKEYEEYYWNLYAPKLKELDEALRLMRAKIYKK